MADIKKIKLGTTTYNIVDANAARKDHTHDVSIAASSETNELTLAHGTKYALTAGGQSFIFTMPTDNNTNTDRSSLAYCETGASTAAKTATMPGFALSSGQYIFLRTTTTNSATSSVTLNINSTGAKPVKIGNSSTNPTASNFPAGDYLAKYDGTNWILTRIYLTDTNTTYDLSAAKSKSNGSVTLDLKASGSGSGTDSVTIKGTGATTVTTDANGIITINSTDTNTDTNTTYTLATGDSNGQIKVTPSSGGAYNVSVKGLAAAAYKGTTTSVTSGSSDLVTSGAVYTAIQNLPEPMIFKGTLGTNGTLTSLPTAATSNEGYTYKVITAGTYANKSAKVGDIFISTGSVWELIPAGDTDSDTWRNIKVNGTELLGNGVSTGAVNLKSGTNVTISGSGNDITISATDTNTHNSHKINSGKKSDGTTDIKGSASSGDITLGDSGVTAGTYRSVTVNSKGIVVGGDNTDADTNTWRKVQLNGTDKLGTGTNTNPLNIKAGSNMTITESSGTFTFAATDTTYSNATTSAAGLMSKDDKSKLDGIATSATKVEASSTNGKIKINGTDTTVYTHPGSGTNPHGTTKSDVGLGNVGNFKAVSTAASQGLTDTEKANARANIGAGTSSFSGSYTDLTNKPVIPVNFTDLNNRGEEYLAWGGPSWTGSVSPVGVAMSLEHSTNRLAFINGDALNFEYSSDGGSNWTNYNYSASDKSAFCTTSKSVPIGRPDTSTNLVANKSKSRITLTAQDGTTGYVYTSAKKMLVRVSSATTLSMLVEYRTGTNYKNGGAWTTFGTYNVSGWSGWNDIPLVLNTLGGGTTQTSNNWQLRLTFTCTTVNSNYPKTAEVLGIRIFGDNDWTSPSTMAATGHLYSFDMSKNATFPAGVSAITFTENGTTLANKYLGKSATAANSSKLNNQEASYYLNYNNFTNRPTIPTTDTVSGWGYTKNTGTVIGSSLTDGYFVIGNGGVNVDISAMKPTTSSTSWSTSSDVNVPTMKAISNYVTGLGYKTTDNNTASAADNILDGSNSGTQITYAPYASGTATSTWVGTDTNAGKLYLGTVNPSKTTRLNYNGYLYGTKLYSGGKEVITDISGKQDTLTAQTAYTSKGSATKVPQITTNSLGQVTGITEVTITQPTVNNAKLTLNVGGAAVSGNDAFTANDSTDTTYNVPTATSSAFGVVKTSTGITNSSGTISVTYGTTAETACVGNDSRLSDSRTPKSHTHGNITNDGTITSSAVTSATGVLVYDSSNKIQRATAANARAIIGALASTDTEDFSIAITQGGSGGTALAANSYYTITAGGASMVFKTPADTNTKVTQTQTTGNYNYPLLLAGNSTSTSTTKTTTTYKNYNNLYANPYSGQLTASSFYAISDRRLKENIKEFNPQKSILELPIVEFDFKDTNSHQIGCIAQDLQEICPEIVFENENGYLSINENKIVYLLLDEVKKLKAEVENLKKEN